MILKLNDITYTAVEKDGDVVLKKCLSNVFSMNPLLPSRYIPLEYLKGRNIKYSNGANILTGKVIKFSEGESIKVVFDLADVPSDGYRAVLGVGGASTDDNLWLMQYNETNDLSLYVKCQDRRNSIGLNTYLIPHKNEIIIDENGYSINGVDGTFSTKKLSDGTNTMSLFGTRPNSSNVSYTSSCKIYEYVHYDSDGEELMHLYPCRDNITNNLGMYDTVGETFIQNSNQNVNFIDGPVTELSDGTIKSHSSGIYKYWTDADKQYIEGYCWAEDGESMQSKFTVSVNNVYHSVPVNADTGYWRYDINFEVTSLYFCLRADSIGKLKSANFHIDWSDVTDVSYMCYLSSRGGEQLESITGNFAWTNKCKEAYSAFNGCTILTEVNLSKCDFSGMTDMRSMFNTCYSLKTIHKNKISTVNECNISRMFLNCSSLVSYGDDYLDMSGVKGYFDEFNPFYAYAAQRPLWTETTKIGFPSITSSYTTWSGYYAVGMVALTDIHACGKLYSTVSFEFSPLTLASAKVVLNALQDVSNTTLHPTGETLTFSASTKALINADTEALNLVNEKRLLGWTIAL